MGFLWTLHVEFCFYVAVPLLFICIMSDRFRSAALAFIAMLSIVLSTLDSGVKIVSHNLFAALQNLVLFVNNFTFGCIAAILLSQRAEIRKPLVALFLAAAALLFIFYASRTA